VSEEWQVLSLADAGVTLLDCDHKTPEAVESGWPYVGIPQMNTGRVDFSTARRITHADFIAWTRKTKYQKDDVILSRRTNPGVTAIDDTGTEFALGQNLVLLRADGRRVYPPFLRWLVRGPEWWVQIEKFINVGAVFSSLRCRDVPSFELTIPPLPEQRAIAATLRALDDKIELNRKMNATLEAMARALFRDWFGDFGPTRAKIEGRPPYLSPDLWSLFPDHLDDEGKPEGWDIFRLEQIAEHHKRTLSPSLQPDTVFEHFSLPAFDKGQSPALDIGESIKSNKTVVPQRAVLLSKLNPEIPRVWLPQAVGNRPQITSTEFLAYTGRNGVERGLLFCLFSDDQFREILQSMVTGTSKSHQRISPPDLLRREVLTGHLDMFAHFEAMVAPLLNRVLANRAESRTLARTRDLLLPRLMSGELRVAEADRMVEEIA